jgi:hypothetical protein
MRNYYLIIVIFFLGNLFACQDHILEEGMEEKYGINNPVKINNPYSVENMQIALDSIKLEWKGKTKAVSVLEGIEIKPTNYYVKLMPSSHEEEGLLKQDTTLHLFDYPLDYEFTDEYLDNRVSLKEGEFPTYYTYVAVDKKLPDVSYEILDELYNPDADPYFEDGTSGTKAGYISEKENLLTSLLKKSFSLTGNEDEFVDENESKTKIWIFGSKWYPSGNIQIWDDDAGQSTVVERVFSHWEYVEINEDLEPLRERELRRLEDKNPRIIKRAVYKYVSKQIQGKYVPLEGAQVLIRQLFTIHNATTDANGNFRAGRTRGKARYIIQWERKHYSIRSGSIGQAELRGPQKKKEEWNYKIKGGKHEYYGHIHRAAHNYYYKNIGGLRRPPLNGFLKNQIKIAAYDYYDSKNRGRNDHYARILNYITPTTGILQAWPTISLKMYGRSPSDIFGVTSHELAHSTHAKNAGLKFIDSELRLIETYANTLEWHLTTKYYKQYVNNFVFQNNYQNFSPASKPVYTSLMVDLIDSNNQPYVVDRVSGYTMNQIENEAFRNHSFASLKNDLRDRYYNSTEQYLDELFNNWN